MSENTSRFLKVFITARRDDSAVLAVAVCQCLSVRRRYCIETANGIEPVFTARRYASAVLAVVVCLSVCLSVRHKPVLHRNG